MFKNEDLIARRAGRVAFGAVLVGGALAFVTSGLSGWPMASTWILIGTWMVAVAMLVAARVFAPRLPVRDENALRVKAMVLPAVGAALLTPLSLHLLPSLISGGAIRAPHRFDEWSETSLFLVGAAHLVFAALTGLRAYQLALGRAKVMSIAWIVTATLFAALIPYPFFALFTIPVIALTAVPILWLLWKMRSWAEADREVRLPMARVA